MADLKKAINEKHAEWGRPGQGCSKERGDVQKRSNLWLLEVFGVKCSKKKSGR